MSHYTIRELSGIAEYTQAEALQRLVWDDPSTVIYAHMLISLGRNGGSVLGAFDGDILIGVLISYLGLEDPEGDRPAMANLKLVSQRMAVMPAHRDAGIGYELKVAQRKLAQRLGIRLVTWTFDPLISRNAHLNIRKLGAIVREFHRDIYGAGPGPLTTFGSSDRLLVEWWVTNNRVEQRIEAKRAGLTLTQYLAGNSTILNLAGPALRGYIQPTATPLQPEGNLVLAEIPANIYDIRDDDPDLAVAWRDHVREVFEKLFSSNYVMTDFVRGEHDGRVRTFYVFSYGDVTMGRFRG